MHAEVAYQAVLAGQLLLPLRISKTDDSFFAQMDNKYIEEVAPW